MKKSAFFSGGGGKVWNRRAATAILTRSGARKGYLNSYTKTYKACKDKLTLEDLVRKVIKDYAELAGGDFSDGGSYLSPGKDWQCLWPVGKTVKEGEYHKNLKKGAKFDVSNLVPTELRDNRLNINLFALDSVNYKARFDAGAYWGTFITPTSENAAFEAIAKRSKMGGNPISYFAVHGHHGKGSTYMFNNIEFSIPRFIAFAAKKLNSAKGTPLEKAKSKYGPPRCWFSVNANARFFGCNTNDGIAGPFATGCLRKGATAYGTKSTCWSSPTKGYSLDGGKTYEKGFNNLIKPEYWDSFNGGL